MKKNSPKAKALKEALRSNQKALFADIQALLAKHGHKGLRIRSFGVESDLSDCGGKPRVPLQVIGEDGKRTTIWVCPG
jgi:hypothetical protein